MAAEGGAGRRSTKNAARPMHQINRAKRTMRPAASLPRGLDAGVACSLCDLVAEPVELRPAADDGVLPGVEGADPHPAAQRASRSAGVQGWLRACS
jgi:hypothetical protein